MNKSLSLSKGLSFSATSMKRSEEAKRGVLAGPESVLFPLGFYCTLYVFTRVSLDDEVTQEFRGSVKMEEIPAFIHLVSRVLFEFYYVYFVYTYYSM